MRRLKHRLRSTDVVLFTDWTLLRLFPPLRAMWAAIGTQAQVCITGQNARRARVARSTVHRWITRYLEERTPCLLYTSDAADE